jgi:hypothetical protein
MCLGDRKNRAKKISNIFARNEQKVDENYL